MTDNMPGDNENNNISLPAQSTPVDIPHMGSDDSGGDSCPVLSLSSLVCSGESFSGFINQPPTPPLIISIEGLIGCGKSTALTLAKPTQESLGFAVHL